METIFTKKIGNKILNVNYASDIESPRSEMDNLFTIHGYLNKYSNCFDELVSRETFMDVVINGNGEIGKTFAKTHICFPLYIYEHGRVAFSINSFNDRFDSGIGGYMFVEKTKIYEEYSVKRISKKLLDKLADIAKSELVDLTSWANGEIYEFTIENIDGEILDQCSGYYSIEEATTDGLDILRTTL